MYDYEAINEMLATRKTDNQRAIEMFEKRNEVATKQAKESFARHGAGTGINETDWSKVFINFI